MQHRSAHHLVHEAGAALNAEQLDEAAPVHVVPEGAHELRVQVVGGVRVLRVRAHRQQNRHRELLELLAEVVAPAQHTVPFSTVQYSSMQRHGEVLIQMK